MITNSSAAAVAIRKLHVAIKHAEEAIQQLRNAPSEMTNYQAAVSEAVGALTNILCRLEALKDANDKEVAWQKSQDDFYRVYGPLLERLAKSGDQE